MDRSGNSGFRAPPGYPSGETPPAKRKCCPRTSKKGEGSFIEGCLAALCCCWLFDVCCD